MYIKGIYFKETKTRKNSEVKKWNNKNKRTGKWRFLRFYLRGTGMRLKIFQAEQGRLKL